MKNDDANNSFCNPSEVSAVASSCCGTSTNDKTAAACCDAEESASCCGSVQTTAPKKEGVATIEVVGPGCASCQQLHKIVQYVSPNLGIENEVIYLSGQEGISRMMQLGAMQAPILVVNGKIAMRGYSPSTEKIKEAILEAAR